MIYRNRHIEKVLSKAISQFPVLLLTGPRQVGKSTIMRHMSGSQYEEVSFDDPLIRAKAEDEPALFFKNHRAPLLLDEIQYVPNLFPYLKMQVDRNRRDGDFLMTGSQAFVLMKNVSESLAGRVGILELQGISLRKSVQCAFDEPFIPSEPYLEKREESLVPYDNLWMAIHRGYMPELVF